MRRDGLDGWMQMGMRITMREGGGRADRHQKMMADWFITWKKRRALGPARWELELLEAKERREKENEMK
jgi:hypothetical protein